MEGCINLGTMHCRVWLTFDLYTGSRRVPIKRAPKLNRLRDEDEEFRRLISRAGLVVENIGVVGAFIGDGMRKQVSIFEQAVQSLQPATTGAR